MKNIKSDFQIVYQFYRLNVNFELFYILNYSKSDRIYCENMM